MPHIILCKVLHGLALMQFQTIPIQLHATLAVAMVPSSSAMCTAPTKAFYSRAAVTQSCLLVSAPMAMMQASPAMVHICHLAVHTGTLLLQLFTPGVSMTSASKELPFTPRTSSAFWILPSSPSPQPSDYRITASTSASQELPFTPGTSSAFWILPSSDYRITASTYYSVVAEISSSQTISPRDSLTLLPASSTYVLSTSSMQATSPTETGIPKAKCPASITSVALANTVTVILKNNIKVGVHAWWPLPLSLKLGILKLIHASRLVRSMITVDMNTELKHSTLQAVTMN